jgi:hypothetical protein
MANVTVTLTGDEAKLLQSLQKVIDKENELDRTVAKVKNESTGWSDSTVNHFAKMDDAGAKFNERLAMVGKGAMAVGVAIVESLRRAKAEMDALASSAGQQVESMANPLRSLAAISGGDPKRLVQLRNLSESIYKSGYVGSEAEAASFVSAGTGAGLSDLDIRRIAPLSGGMNIQGAITEASKIQYRFGAQAGGIQNLMGMALAAAGQTGQSPEGLLGMTGQIGGATAQMGWGAEQTMAMAGLAMKGGRGDRGGRTLAGLLDFAQKEGITGTPEEVIRGLGRMEDMTGGQSGMNQEERIMLGVLQSRKGEYNNLLTALQPASAYGTRGGDEVGDYARMIDKDPELTAEMIKRRGVAAKDLSLKGEGINNIILQGLEAERIARSKAAGEGMLLIGAQQAERKIEAKFRSDEGMIVSVGGSGEWMNAARLRKQYDDQHQILTPQRGTVTVKVEGSPTLARPNEDF